MSRHLVGIDGGGSKTAFALADLSGAVLSRFEGDTSNYNQVGYAGVAKVLGEGIAALLARAGLGADAAIAGAVVGIGGVGEVAAEMPPLAEAVGRALGSVPHRLVNDCEVAWAGALALSPGINIVAGTGSLAFGADADGRTARAGGWAWSIGDEGSAHWLARRILQIFSRQSDGRLPRTALYACVRERLGVSEDVEVRFLPMQAPRKELAALSTILPEALARGDESVRVLYREAAEELALHVRGIRSQLAFEEPVAVSATGGVLKLDPFIARVFAAALPGYGARYVEALAAPVEGALMMAARLFEPAALPALRARLLRDGGRSAAARPLATGGVPFPAEAPAFPSQECPTMQTDATEARPIFGMAPDDLARRGGLVTAREIAGQPRLWRALADLLEARSDEIARFLEAPFRHRDLLVVFTGAGTSALAGGVVATEGMAAVGREMRRVATTDLVEGWSRHLDPSRPTLLVSFARSGDSPESVAALEIVDRNCASVWHLVVTCNPDGALARSATGERRFSLVMPEGSCDRGFAMTGSFTAMVLAALSIFACETPAAGAPVVRRLADAAETVLAAWPRAADLAARRHERVVFLGSGPLAEASAECALKLLELTDGEVVATAFSPLAFRHGPKTIVNGPATLVVHLVSGDPAVQRYGVDMAAELARDGRAELFALVPEAGRPDVAAPALGVLADAPVPGDAPVLGDAPILGDGWLAVPYVVFGQVLALLASLERGFATDTPSRSGEVNRVVRNVAIYA